MAKNSNNSSSGDATIFYADTRFERLARRPGGVAREEAIERAQSAVEELKTDYAGWIDQQFADLAEAIAIIEQDPKDKQAIDRAQLKCAYLRDTGATMGYTLVTFVATTLCEVLDAYLAGAAFDKDITDCHMDAFRLARTEEYRHLRPEQVPELAKGLMRVVEVASIVPPVDTKQ